MASEMYLILLERKRLPIPIIRMFAGFLWIKWLNERADDEFAVSCTAF